VVAGERIAAGRGRRQKYSCGLKHDVSQYVGVQKETRGCKCVWVGGERRGGGGGGVAIICGVARIRA
jgi:hypothetical protein